MAPFYEPFPTSICRFGGLFWGPNHADVGDLLLAGEIADTSAETGKKERSLKIVKFWGKSPNRGTRPFGTSGWSEYIRVSRSYDAKDEYIPAVPARQKR